MDIFFDSKASLLLLRSAATNKSIGFVDADIERATPLPVSPANLSRLGISELLAYMRVPDERPLGIIVPHKDARVRSRNVECTIDSRPRGKAPYLQLCSQSSSDPSPLVPQTTRVFVQAPANIVLGMARQLRRKEIVGKLSHQQAVLMLTKLCLELCGTYVHDPFLPNAGPVIYGAPQRIRKKELCEALAAPGAEQGLALAREASDLAYDLSGSPQESFLGPALFCPSRLGGLDFGAFEANQPLKLTREERSTIGHRKITPDFYLEAYRSAVEYLGEVHTEGDNPRIDHRRTLDYQTLGVREFALWYEDVSTRNNFMMTAARIVSVMEQYDGPKVRKRFHRLANLSAFRERQNTLFAVFRPWLRGLPGTSPS